MLGSQERRSLLMLLPLMLLLTLLPLLEKPSRRRDGLGDITASQERKSLLRRSLPTRSLLKQRLLRRRVLPRSRPRRNRLLQRSNCTTIFPVLMEVFVSRHMGRRRQDLFSSVFILVELFQHGEKLRKEPTHLDGRRSADHLQGHDERAHTTS